MFLKKNLIFFLNSKTNFRRKKIIVNNNLKKRLNYQANFNAAINLIYVNFTFNIYILYDVLMLKV